MYVCMFLCVCELLPSAELGSVIQPCSRSRFLGLTASKDQSQQSYRAQRERASDRQGSASMPSLTPVMRPETRGAHAHSSISLSVFATVLQKLLLLFIFFKDNFKLLLKGSLFFPVKNSPATVLKLAMDYGCHVILKQKLNSFGSLPAILYTTFLLGT